MVLDQAKEGGSCPVEWSAPFRRASELHMRAVEGRLKQPNISRPNAAELALLREKKINNQIVSSDNVDKSQCRLGRVWIAIDT
jgi:hypothetical protein